MAPRAGRRTRQYTTERQSGFPRLRAFGTPDCPDVPGSLGNSLPLSSRRPGASLDRIACAGRAVEHAGRPTRLGLLSRRASAALSCLFGALQALERWHRSSHWSRGRGSNPHPKRPLRGTTGAHKELRVSRSGFPTIQVQPAKMSWRRPNPGGIKDRSNAPLVFARPYISGPARGATLQASRFFRFALSGGRHGLTSMAQLPRMSSVCITAREINSSRFRSGPHPRQTQKD